MNGQEILIGGKRFLQPLLDALVIDPWQGYVELRVGETGQPHSWSEPELVRIRFSGVIEVRTFCNNANFTRGEVWEAGEEEAIEEFSVEGGERPRFVNPAFRKAFGFSWHSNLTSIPRLVWIAADVFYIEFVYAGAVTHPAE